MKDTYSCGHVEERRGGIMIDVDIDKPCPSCASLERAEESAQTSAEEARQLFHVDEAARQARTRAHTRPATYCDHCGTQDIDSDVHLCARKLEFDLRAAKQSYENKVVWLLETLRKSAEDGLGDLRGILRDRVGDVGSIEDHDLARRIGKLHDSALRDSMFDVARAVQIMKRLGLHKQADLAEANLERLLSSSPKNEKPDTYKEGDL
jgi:hypothetical protein